MSNITFAPFPIPVVVDGLGDCLVVSQTNSGTFEDDLWTIAKCDGGQMLHVRTSQMKMHHNTTMGISKDSTLQRAFNEYPHKFPSSKWTDEEMVEFAAFYTKQENYMDPQSILAKFKLMKK